MCVPPSPEATGHVRKLGSNPHEARMVRTALSVLAISCGHFDHQSAPLILAVHLLRRTDHARSGRQEAAGSLRAPSVRVDHTEKRRELFPKGGVAL